MSLPATILIHVEPHLLASALVHVLTVLGHQVTAITPGAERHEPARFDVAVVTGRLPEEVEARTVLELRDRDGRSMLTWECGDQTWEHVSSPTDLAWLLDRIEHGAA